MTNQRNVRVAVVQAASVIMDKEASAEKAIALTKEAGEKGANMVVFPEAFIPAYPRGLSFGAVVGSRAPEGRKDWLRYWENAVPVPSETTKRLGEAAREAGVYLVIGLIERDTEYSGGTLCCSILFFGPDGSLLGKHRKLKPTGSERLIWGEGDGSTLPVFDTPYGKIGALICWENYMPLARAAMYVCKRCANLHCTYCGLSGTLAVDDSPHCRRRQMLCAILQPVRKQKNVSERPGWLRGIRAFTRRDVPGRQRHCGSFRRLIKEPVFGKEDILIADLDLHDIAYSQFDFDVVGHYSRPDVFQLLVHEEKKKIYILKSKKKSYVERCIFCKMKMIWNSLRDKKQTHTAGEVYMHRIKQQLNKKAQGG